MSLDEEALAAPDRRVRSDLPRRRPRATCEGVSASSRRRCAALLWWADARRDCGRDGRVGRHRQARLAVCEAVAASGPTRGRWAMTFDCGDRRRVFDPRRARGSHAGLPRARAESTRMHRIVRAAMAKTCVRSCLHPVDVDQPQVGFVDQRGRLQGVTSPFGRHIPVGQPVQFVVDEWNQAIKCTLLAATPSQQKVRRRRAIGQTPFNLLRCPALVADESTD